jgi:hypothetical protein
MAVSTFPEKRLLWHPRKDNKFVVGGGSDIALYEWAPDHPEIRHVTSRHDLQFMKVRTSTLSHWLDYDGSQGFIISVLRGLPTLLLTT